MVRRILLVLVISAVAYGCSSARDTPSAKRSTSTSLQVTTSTEDSVPSVPSTVPPTTSPTPTTASVPAGCVDRQSSSALDGELVRANGSPGGETVPGSVYYGTCATTGYAVSRFQPAPGSTPQEQVSFQDAGGFPRFFIEASGQGWKLAGSASSRNAGCSSFTELPAALRTLWQGCPQG